MTECEKCYRIIPDDEPLHEFDDLYICQSCYDDAVDYAERLVDFEVEQRLVKDEEEVQE